jgi:hypothetical protein
LNQYPDNDVLPGLSESVMYDENYSLNYSFDKETAGFDEHFAQEFMRSWKFQEIEKNKCLMDKSGTTDPELSDTPARTLTASALRNVFQSSF